MKQSYKNIQLQLGHGLVMYNGMVKPLPIMLGKVPGKPKKATNLG
jgi:hypothetical protein